MMMMNFWYVYGREFLKSTMIKRNFENNYYRNYNVCNDYRDDDKDKNDENEELIITRKQIEVGDLLTKVDFF